MINGTYSNGNNALNSESYYNRTQKLLAKKHKYHLTAKAKQFYTFLAQGLAFIFLMITIIFVMYFYFL